MPRRQIAMMSASATSCAVISAFIDQPTTRAGDQVDDSRDVEPAFGRPDIREAGYPFLVRPLGYTLPVEDIGRCERSPKAVVLRKATTPWAGPQGLGAHPPFDCVQAAGDAFRQNIPPDTAGAIGASAAHTA